jgi:hypothetical protein
MKEPYPGAARSEPEIQRVLPQENGGGDNRYGEKVYQAARPLVPGRVIVVENEYQGGGADYYRFAPVIGKHCPQGTHFFFYE